MLMQNCLTPELDLQQGISDIYDYDGSIFDRMQLPEGVNRDLTLDAIFSKYGHTPLFRPDPSWLKYYIGSWSLKNAYTWSKLYATMTVEYDPIANYDRTETTTDTRTMSTKGGEDEAINRKGSVTDTGTATTTEDRSEEETNTQNDTHAKGTTLERTISADNSSTYQPDNRESASGSDTDTSRINNSSESSATTSNTTNAAQNSTDDTGRKLSRIENVTESTQHDMRTYGNIGVTTTQTMLKSEREVVQFNIYDFIADSFKNEFCLLIY